MSIGQRMSTIPVVVRATGCLITVVISVGLMEKQALRASFIRVATRADGVNGRCELRSSTNSSFKSGLGTSCSQVSVFVLDFVDQLITRLRHYFITLVHWVSMVCQVVVSRQFFFSKVLAFQNTRPFVTIFRCKFDKMLFPKSFNLAFKQILACIDQTFIFFRRKNLL